MVLQMVKWFLRLMENDVLGVVLSSTGSSACADLAHVYRTKPSSGGVVVGMCRCQRGGNPYFQVLLIVA